MGISRSILTILLISTSVFAQSSNGKEGNRVVGVVYKEDGSTPFNKDEASVYVYNRESNQDYTNADGLYYVYLSPDIKKFMLIYKADGYWRAGSSVLNNDHDPIKLDKVLLERKNPNKLSQLEGIEKTLDFYYDLYREATSQRAKREIREELVEYFNAIVIPPPRTELLRERAVKLDAKAKIETLLAQLK